MEDGHSNDPNLLKPYLNLDRFLVPLSLTSAVAGERRRGDAPECQPAYEESVESDNTGRKFGPRLPSAGFITMMPLICIPSSAIS
jgi:hypothetical protein